MGLKAFLIELRRRGVLRAAAAYAAIGWVALEGLSLLFQNFDAPGWVIKVLTTLVLVGFPVACLMAWGFDITPEGVRPVPPTPEDAAPAPSAAAAHLAQALEPSAPPSIAVLPFLDMSAEHDQQYLGDGIAEELLNALTAIEGLNVAARTSSFSFHGKSATMKEIGEVLHVGHVLEGSVRRSGPKLRVTAQLIDVASGFHLFSQSYDRAMQDIFDIQNEIAREIASALLPKLGLRQDATLVRQGTTNLEAYNLRLKAHRWVREPSPGTIRTAIEQLRQAIALDRDYSDAWGDLAYMLAHAAVWEVDPVPMLIEAHHAAEVALAEAPDNVHGLLVRAYLSILVHHDAKAAQAWAARARAVGVDRSVWAYNNAFLHDGPLGRYEDAITALKEAERSDPLAVNVKWALVTMYLAAGRNADAAAMAGKLRDMVVAAPDGIGTMGLGLGDAAEARRARDALEALVAAAPRDFEHVVYLHQFGIDGVIGDSEHARRLLDELLRRVASGDRVSPEVIAEGYKAIGDYDRAIDWWTRAVDQHVPYTLAYMAVTSRSHPVIGKDPRFVALLERMGLHGAPEGPKTAG